jgi:chromosome segregation ATPase
MEMATIGELENRVRFLASEVEGEKPVTRTVLEQAIRNGDVMNAVRSEVATMRVDLLAITSRTDHIAGDVAVGNAALRNHGILLTMLQQDMGAIRGDVTLLRRDMEAVNGRLDETNARLDETNARLDETNSRLDRMEHNIAIILAAVVPGNPPPAG